VPVWKAAHIRAADILRTDHGSEAIGLAYPQILPFHARRGSGYSLGVSPPGREVRAQTRPSTLRLLACPASPEKASGKNRMF
jgi:hypothetical protein